jgi:hypothetical protein
MKKMSLKVEDLAVESFDTSGAQPPRGTVVAHDSETDLVSCTSCGQTYCGNSCEFCTGYQTCAGWNTCVRLHPGGRLRYVRHLRAHGPGPGGNLLLPPVLTLRPA